MLFFLLNDTATTDIDTLSLHDALPISSISTTRKEYMTIGKVRHGRGAARIVVDARTLRGDPGGVASYTEALIEQDRKSTRLNSSHLGISYAVFCLKKKKKYT